LARRRFVEATLAAPLLSGCGAPRLAQPSLRGLTLDSESVQLSCYSDYGLSGFTVRVGRFPSVDRSWVWAHAFTPRTLVGYTDDRLPDAERTDRATSTAWTQTTGASLHFVRSGSSEQPDRVRLSARWAGHATARAAHGPGAVPVTIEAEFVPDRLAAGVLAGRSEAKGTVHATMRVGKETSELAGAGHYHEQRQSAPRFVAPFVYIRGSNADMAFTFIRARRPSGSLVDRAGETPLQVIDITAPARARRFRASLADGRKIEGSCDETHRFWVPIFDGWRSSQIVTGAVDGRRWVGAINDWQGEAVGYWKP
jgi:hypothetical protein